MDSIELLRAVVTKYHAWVSAVTGPGNEEHGLKQMEDDSPEAKTSQFIVLADALVKLADKQSLTSIKAVPPKAVEENILTAISGAYARSRGEGEFMVRKLIAGTL